MRSALRGTLAGVSALAFVALGGALYVRTAPPSVLVGLAVVALGTLLAVGGRPALFELLGREPGADGDETADAIAADDPDWWLARVEPALDDSWNRWSEAVLTLGLAAVGIGSFVLLVTHSGEDPPLGLLVTGTLGINGALLTLAFVFE
ncbi:hypothetical protein [Halorubrum kocurii]|uniref:Uncharacterized protein n=1 Tax=Halorubrum kocurii JCM 14978 TaxID=1230456 RepID=M0P6R6_9EURY|nr:hypothetical protein [Halorubrum kocurii]EMA65852.1 hypothetical protein C468_05413 [Halorubrum kocurii JCM 14978]